MSRGTSSLTLDDVRLIKSLIAERKRLEAKVRALSNAELANKFDASPYTIAEISCGRRWANVEASQ